MNKLTISSPAKINIGLVVKSRRDDNYHNIETIFYPLLLSDTIYFEKSDSTEYVSNSNQLNNTGKNLISEAKEYLEEQVGRALNVKIKLEKNIPIGAGLGGGSSNAAATLKALNKLFDLNCNLKILLSIALKIGSDVPFFINPVPCFAYSRGEKMRRVQLLLSEPILVVNPGIHISTKWAFDQINISQQNNGIKKLSEKKVITIEDIRKFAVNDFEQIVFNKFPEVKALKEKLYSFTPKFVMLTGTGSSVYAIFTNLQKARNAKEYFENKYFTYLNYPVDKASIT